jgi:serine/threonine-protein kinase
MHGEFDAVCAGCGAALPLVSSDGGRRDDLSGSTVSRFRVLGLLGRGGMGVVYRAVDLELGRQVALKLLAPHLGGDPREEERFLEEARAAAALDHPNIGMVLEIGEHQGRRFLAMPLYDGETLEQRLARVDEHGPLSIPEVLALASQLAAALAAAHAAGVIHRDLKPGNVLLTRESRLKLLDFGLARRRDAARLTEGGALVGTAAYMAPEQLRGEELDARTDLWAFGAVLYEALTGRPPFGRGWPQPVQGVVHAILAGEPPPLRTVRPETPAPLEAIVRRCLSKDPPGRPAGAAEILVDLRAAGLLRDVGSVESGAFEPLPAAPGRKLLRILAASSMAGALALLVTLALRQAGPATATGPLQVAAPVPEIRGSLDGGSRSLLEANLQTSVLRALTGLDGIAPIDPSQVDGIRGGPRQVARAVAAGEVLTTAADCAGDLCQITLRRLDGAGERLLWTETLRAPLSHPQLLGEAVAAGVRHGYADRRPRAGSAAAPEIDEADYERYLDLRQRVRGRGALLPDVLRELDALRRRAPDFLEVSVLEISLCRSLFVQTRNAAYLERGLDVARRARERDPGDPRPLFSLFDLNLADGRLDPAEETLKQLEAAQPGSASVLLRRSLLLERRGDKKGARDAMKLAAEIRPSWQVLLLRANLEYRLGQPGEARRCARELLERYPESREGGMLLAQIELMEGNPGAAIPLLERLARDAPDEKVASNLGVAFFLTGRFGPAEEAFRQALALNAGHLPAQLGRADALELQGRTAEARDLYRQVAAAAEKPGAWAVGWARWSIEAQALAHLGEGREAVAAIQEALRLAPDSPQLAYEAALVYALLGDRSSALYQADRALSGGVRPVWFQFSWFDPLRNDPAFARRLKASSESPPGPA